MIGLPGPSAVISAITVGAAVAAGVLGSSGGPNSAHGALRSEAALVTHSRTSSASSRAADDPLIGGPWGIYTGGADGVYPAYAAARGSRRTLLAKVALRPRVRWFTSHIAPTAITGKVRSYIAQEQAGDPRTLVQLAAFRLWPQGERNKRTPLSGAQQAAYKAWVNGLAAGIGSARTAVVLEPDLGVALSSADPAVRLGLARYAAQRLAGLPRTTVYIDAADADWLTVDRAVAMLRAAGVQYVRGFALGATHYSSVPANIEHGTAVVQALAAAGMPGKHFVIDTADNGEPFTWPYWHSHQARLGSDWDNPATCAGPAQGSCDTLGIPPTTSVDAPVLDLSPTDAEEALSYVDGYLWFGRPWLIDQASPFSLARTLAVAASTPYQH